MPEPIDIAGELVRLRTTTADDKTALIAIRATDEVRRWWRGDDLASEFDDEHAESALDRLATMTLNG